MKKSYSAQLENLHDICQDVENFCAQNQIGATDEYAINLALDEIFTNIVTYGYKEDASKNVEIELGKDGENISILVRDTAPKFNPLEEVATPDITTSIEERDIGGLGVFFIKKNMTALCYDYNNGANEFSMIRKISK